MAMFPKEHIHLDDQTLDWVINKVDKHAKIIFVQQLKGSTSSSLYRISLEVDDHTRDVVLRKFDRKDWVDEEPNLACHEAKSLIYASQANVSTPTIIAYEESGFVCGVPMVLMTFMKGDVQLKPQNMEQWINELAKSLVTIHEVEAKDLKWSYLPYNDILSFEVPTWTTTPINWKKLINIARRPRPAYKECFIHRDYHPANVLYKNGNISGVVDWVNACKGPAGIDVGHCRLNLALLYNVSIADQFLMAYQNIAGESFAYDVYWDVISVIDILFGPPTVYPSWEAFGVTDLTDQLMEKRLDEYIKSLVSHL